MFDRYESTRVGTREQRGGGQVEEKRYEAPAMFELGAVRDLTAQNKCGGSGDSFLPQNLDPLAPDACAPSP
jgi:hypothetical protein